MMHSLNRLTAAVLVGFLAVALSLTYWSIFAADDLQNRTDNPRRVEFEQMLRRGAIYDRNGVLLAQTVDAGRSTSGKPLARRDYPQPDALSAIGYYSLAHGGVLIHGGVEDAFDSTLRGDDALDASQRALDSLLHRPQTGSDVRLTLDSALQSIATTALKPYSGAVVLIDVPSGAVRAMVSAPAYDPNTLDADFDKLLKDPAAPLINRVIQGVYQPGGALETVVFSALLTDRVALDSLVGTAPLQVGDLTLACTLSDTPTLEAAYAAACPAPFALAAYEHRQSVEQAIEAFGLLHPPALARFQTLAGPPPPPLYALADDQTLLEQQGAGQGALTVTPLQMALVAAIANHGNGISLYLVDATRAPGAKDWQKLVVPNAQPAITSQDAANKLRLAMRAAVSSGAAQAADHAGLSIDGHASFAYTGPQKNAVSWFIGFIDLPDGSSVAAAVVLENTRDLDAAARVGGVTLAAVSNPKAK